MLGAPVAVSDDDLLVEISDERDRYGELLVRVETALGLGRGPGAGPLGGELGARSAAARVERWLTEQGR